MLGVCRRSAKSSQNHPRSAPRDPKSDPGGVKSGPGEPQERPGRGPGAARRHLKIGLNALLPPRAPGRGPGATPERSWKRFWSLPGLIWELFGSPRDFIFKLFRSCPRTLRLQPLCPTNAGSAGPALAFTIDLCCFRGGWGAPGTRTCCLLRSTRKQHQATQCGHTLAWLPLILTTTVQICLPP